MDEIYASVLITRWGRLEQRDVGTGYWVLGTCREWDGVIHRSLGLNGARRGEGKVRRVIVGGVGVGRARRLGWQGTLGAEIDRPRP